MKTAPAVLTVEQLERLLSLRRSVEEEVSVSRYAAAQDYDQALNDHADALLETARAYHRLTSALEFLHDQSGLEIPNNSLYPEELISMACERGWSETK